jgi:limonene-1,2-epoxide hydrolase
MGDEHDYEALTRDFCKTWELGDTAAVVAWFTDDATYHNIPVDPLVGHEAIAGMVDMFTTGLTVVEFKILEMVSRGSTVVTERVDIFRKPDGSLVELPVMGILEWEGDKLANWREYFDLNQFMSQAAGAVG